MIKRKDNLTDVVQQLPKVTVTTDKPLPKPVDGPNKKPNQTVVGDGGQVVTLGQNKQDKK